MGVWNVTAGFVSGRFTSFSSWRAERAYYLMSCLISAVYRVVSGGALGRDGREEAEVEVEVAVLGLSSLEKSPQLQSDVPN